MAHATTYQTVAALLEGIALGAGGGSDDSGSGGGGALLAPTAALDGLDWVQRRTREGCVQPPEEGGGRGGKWRGAARVMGVHAGTT